MYFDSESSWFCVGNSDIKDQTTNINFIDNAIAVLNIQGELQALWINPIFDDDIPLTLPETY